jgi:hypothetical protein
MIKLEPFVDRDFQVRHQEVDLISGHHFLNTIHVLLTLLVQELQQAVSVHLGNLDV